MPFLLRYEHRPDGTTIVVFDDGPTRRVQMLTLSEQAHVVLEVKPDQLFDHTLRTVSNRTEEA